MKCRAKTAFATVHGEIQAGSIVNIPDNLLDKFKDRIEPLYDPELKLWRWFVTEADKIYRASSKTADSWNLHKGHKRSAVACCRDGDIPAARLELEKALQVLQGVMLMQQDLI
jgi:hypothetical protein